MFYTFLANNISICTKMHFFTHNLHLNEAGLVDKTYYHCDMALRLYIVYTINYKHSNIKYKKKIMFVLYMSYC